MSISDDLAFARAAVEAGLLDQDQADECCDLVKASCDHGVPRGLERCPVCGDHRGECLDPNSRLGNLVVPVHCLCDADNRCGACGGLLGERKLNGNQYDPSDGGVWHLGAFTAFSPRGEPTNTRQGAGLFSATPPPAPPSDPPAWPAARASPYTPSAANTRASTANADVKPTVIR